MSRTTLALALAGLLAAAPTLDAQPPAGSPPATQPPARQRRPMPRRLDRAADRPGFGGPGGRGARGGMMGFPMGGASSLAERLLGQTGELRLTDQQVVRLAAIARRADDRRRALRTRMDSLRTTLRADTTARRRGFRPGGPGFPGAAGGPLAADLQRMRDQARADLRDALSVLTPDQQAQAWEMRSLRR
ncbi:hypothetical protein J421_1257 [Gemmatirosa kalamazoonensis]|uniref:LTXXQ motif family protein n=1 Tax=Gemmatirosa kalamazoonensis TaxID=861299 RepID=W0RCH5_9BACT|nr:hypothetical protein [Gemmatirosa kalamazoonensis]AHG88794.1 hypothetical protein J421_1257 [Gemmatirosa kalamazoonensis]